MAPMYLLQRPEVVCFPHKIYYRPHGAFSNVFTVFVLIPPKLAHSMYVLRVLRASRFKKHNKKVPVKENLAMLKGRVMSAGVLHRYVENVIPRESWTPDLDK